VTHEEIVKWCRENPGRIGKAIRRFTPSASLNKITKAWKEARTNG